MAVYKILCVILSSTSLEITILTELYSNPCALCIETAYATWKGMTVSIEFSSSSVLFKRFVVKRIIALPEFDGEREDTLSLLAYDNNCDPDDIEVRIENDASNVVFI